MVDYNIRKPTDKEILKCINIFYSAFERPLPTKIKTEEKLWKALIESEIGIFLISERNEKLFGVGGIFIFGKVSSFGYMAVLPEYRCKGIGTEIFKGLLEIANQMKCETNFLFASKLGKPIYQRFGFQESFYATMYQLPKQKPEFRIGNYRVKVLKKIPKWVLSLDKQAIGYDRERYLKYRVEFGAKILAVENDGFGLLANSRLGPLIATNHSVAQQIVRKSINLGASHMIITKHNYVPKSIFKSINLVEEEKNTNIKMVRGKELSENLSLLYAIATYAKG